AAQPRHSASSIRNSSKLRPVPGSTITLGPGGIVVQAKHAGGEGKTAVSDAIHHADSLATIQASAGPVPTALGT
ncbi:MAG: hypothetical protein ACREN5_09440, partial [Gemmatimonadales bacterium]